MRAIGLIGAIFVAFQFGCVAMAQSQSREPTPTQLKAAYCMISMKNVIEFGQNALPSGPELNRVKTLPPTDPEAIFYNKFVDAQNAMIADYNRYRQYVLLALT